MEQVQSTSETTKPAARFAPLKINELTGIAHGAARARGWWDGVIRTEEEAGMLVVTEVAEASEAVRNKLPPICAFAATDPAIRTPDDPVTWNWQLKPEGEATELADVIIRICDFFGWKTWDLATAIQDGLQWGPKTAAELTITELAERLAEQHSWLKDKNPLAAHLYITNWAAKIVETHDAYISLGQCAALTLAYCGAKGLPIEEAIGHKLKYNETRPYRHGGKAL